MSKKASGPLACVHANGKWLAPAAGAICGLPGHPAEYIAIEGVGTYRVFTADNGWLPWVEDYNLEDFEKGCAGDGSAILAFEVPDPHARYAVHLVAGEWCPHMIGNYDTGGSANLHAGDKVHPIDCIMVQYA